MQRIIFISLLFFSINTLAETNNINAPQPSVKKDSNDFFIETIYEKSSEAIISGAQGGLFTEQAFSSTNLYLGLGAVSVDLLKKNYKFNSLRGFLGVSPSWTIAPYAEVGIDLLEEIFDVCNDSHEDYCSTDPSFALGVRWKLSPHLMLNVYHKWYQFDGYILDTTHVNVSGISIGARF